MPPKITTPEPRQQQHRPVQQTASSGRKKIGMEKERSPLPALNAPLAVALLLLLTFMAGEADAQVFCRSQFNLANEACSLRTFPGVNPAVPRRLLNATSSAGYDLQAARDEHGGGGDHGGSDHGGGDHHGSGHGGGGDHSRSHHHGHHGHVGGADPYDTACCRRLMGIDNSCICQAMSFLPVFMSRVKHAIKLTPVPGCDISFECAAVY